MTITKQRLESIRAAIACGRRPAVWFEDLLRYADEQAQRADAADAMRADRRAGQWTIEELDRVWPLPDGWAWRLDDTGPCAVAVACGETWDEGDVVHVVGEGTGLGRCIQRVDRDGDRWPVPVDVARAVIGAHFGLGPQ
jgi:hypothetical protein